MWFDPALASADQFIIGSAMGVAAVAHYSVPMNLVLMRSGVIPMAFGRTFFPTHVQPVRRRGLCTGGARAFIDGVWLCGHSALPAIILSPTFFRTVARRRFRDDRGPRGANPLPGMWMWGLSFVGFTLLQAQGSADLTGKLSISNFCRFSPSSGV